MSHDLVIIEQLLKEQNIEYPDSKVIIHWTEEEIEYISVEYSIYPNGYDDEDPIDYNWWVSKQDYNRLLRIKKIKKVTNEI